MIVQVGNDHIDLTKVVGMSKATSNGYPEYPYIKFHLLMGNSIHAGDFGWNETRNRDIIFDQVYGLWQQVKEGSKFKQVQIKYTCAYNETLLHKINTIKMNTDVGDLIIEAERVLKEKNIKFEFVTEAIIVQ